MNKLGKKKFALVMIVLTIGFMLVSFGEMPYISFATFAFVSIPFVIQTKSERNRPLQRNFIFWAFTGTIIFMALFVLITWFLKYRHITDNDIKNWSYQVFTNPYILFPAWLILSFIEYKRIKKLYPLEAKDGGDSGND